MVETHTSFFPLFNTLTCILYLLPIWVAKTTHQYIRALALSLMMKVALAYHMIVDIFEWDNDAALKWSTGLYFILGLYLAASFLLLPARFSSHMVEHVCELLLIPLVIGINYPVRFLYPFT